MNKKRIIMSMLIFLVTGLSTSSFCLDDYLTKVINENKPSIAQLNFALAQENITALKFAWTKSKAYSKQWLTLTILLAKTQGEAAYLLAIYYQDVPEKAIFWYKTAIRLHYVKASLALAQHYFQQENLKQAAAALATLPINLTEKFNLKANLIKVNIAINQGKVADVKQIISKQIQQLQQSTAGRLLLMDMKKYQVQLDNRPIIASVPISNRCDNSIQLFATNLNHLKQLDRLIEDFKKQSLNHAVCFSPIRYMPLSTLECSSSKNQAIRCNELNWQMWAETITTRYVAIMLPRGGANVHLGVLYFDAQDTVDVVAHEISHLLGFIDEYPLVADHIKCQYSHKEAFSHNISILKNRYQGERKVVRTQVLKQLAWAKHIKKTTPILQAHTDLNNKQYWQLGTPAEFKHEIGLFNAQTCNKSFYQVKGDLSAFKPIFTRTKLQYSALDFPPLYSLLLQNNPTHYRMPSFHYNIALAYFQQGNIEQANYWLEQATSWEVDIYRRKKIRQGEF